MTYTANQFTATNMNAAQLRRWAIDLQQNFPGRRGEAAAAHMQARADLLDAEAGQESGCAAAAIIEQRVPILGLIEIEGGKLRAIEHPYYAEAERIGIHLAMQWYADPMAEEQCGSLIRIFIGSEAQGPLAQYECSSGQWYDLQGRGNHGKKYAHGGTWRSSRSVGIPIIVQKLEDYMDKIAIAKAKLAAANLMMRAATQRAQAEGYYRHAAHPAYEGQSEICYGKAAQVLAYAERTEAQADLILAEAGV